MIIALDYDGTYTADIELWLAFVRNAKERGHRVIVCTMRYEDEGLSIDPRLKDEVEIFYTSRRAKKKYMRNQGIEPNIWIDDNPDWLYEDSK